MRISREETLGFQTIIVYRDFDGLQMGTDLMVCFFLFVCVRADALQLLFVCNACNFFSKFEFLANGS